MPPTVARSALPRVASLNQYRLGQTAMFDDAERFDVCGGLRSAPTASVGQPRWHLADKSDTVPTHVTAIVRNAASSLGIVNAAAVEQPIPDEARNTLDHLRRHGCNSGYWVKGTRCSASRKYRSRPVSAVLYSARASRAKARSHDRVIPQRVSILGSQIAPTFDTLQVMSPAAEQQGPRPVRQHRRGVAPGD